MNTSHSDRLTSGFEEAVSNAAKELDAIEDQGVVAEVMDVFARAVGYVPVFPLEVQKYYEGIIARASDSREDAAKVSSDLLNAGRFAGFEAARLRLSAVFKDLGARALEHVAIDKEDV